MEQNCVIGSTTDSVHLGSIRPLIFIWSVRWLSVTYRHIFPLLPVSNMEADEDRSSIITWCHQMIPFEMYRGCCGSCSLATGNLLRLPWSADNNSFGKSPTSFLTHPTVFILMLYLSSSLTVFGEADKERVGRKCFSFSCVYIIM